MVSAEDWFHVIVDKVDVAGAFKKHEELANAELRTTAAHTNAIVRETRVTAAHTETIAQDGKLSCFVCQSFSLWLAVQSKVLSVHDIAGAYDAVTSLSTLFRLTLRRSH